MNRELVVASSLSLLLHGLLLAGLSRTPWSLASTGSPFRDPGVVHVVLLAPQSLSPSPPSLPPPAAEAEGPDLSHAKREMVTLAPPTLDPPAAPPRATPPAPSRTQPVIRTPAKPKKAPAPPKPEAVMVREVAPEPAFGAGGIPSGSGENTEAATHPMALADPREGSVVGRGGAAGTSMFRASAERGGGEAAGPVEREAVPRYDVNPRPPYPETARRRGMEGTVLLSVLVRNNGTVGDVKLAQTSGHGLLDSAALETVRGWQFLPGRRGERPVEMEIRVPVRFQLE